LGIPRKQKNSGVREHITDSADRRQLFDVIGVGSEQNPTEVDGMNCSIAD
jgi:hypothetical protein